MTLALVNVGGSPNDGSGDQIRTAFQKVNLAINAINTGVGGVSSVSATLAASQNDYAPAGYVAAQTNRLVLTSVTSTITGLLAATDGFSVQIVNAGGGVITFKNASSSSAAANRFNCPNSADATLPNNGVLTATYVTNAWYLQ
jgi:hypothetical protein